MSTKPLYSRWQLPVVLSALKTRRVLFISGPRQCGKTTLAKQLMDNDTEYRTLDDLTQKLLAETDPHGFVKRKKSTLIIDEVQRVPDLLPAIKLVVDNDNTPGQYLLTGSANIQSLPGVQESLAGRIKNLRLRSLSCGEIMGAQPVFIDRAFQRDFSTSGPTTAGPIIDREALLAMAFAGGYPEALERGSRDRKSWHRDYIDALIDRDLMDIARIQRQDAMRELVRIVAAWSGKYMDVSGIGSGLSIRRVTLESYINALEALYLIERVRPWTNTDYERVGRHPKLFMTDCGLMSSILGWRIEQVAMDTDRSGKLIETLVFNELASQIDASDGGYTLSHFRDRDKREIDFVIENDEKDILAIEVKAGSRVGNSDFKHLRWFKEKFALRRSFVGIVLYAGAVAGQMGDGLFAVPFGALWPGEGSQ